MDRLHAELRRNKAVSVVTVQDEVSLIHLAQPISLLRFKNVAARKGFTIRRGDPQAGFYELRRAGGQRLETMRVSLVDEHMADENGKPVMQVIAIKALSQDVPDQLRSRLIEFVSALKPINLKLVRK